MTMTEEMTSHENASKRGTLLFTRAQLDKIKFKQMPADARHSGGFIGLLATAILASTAEVWLQMSELKPVFSTW